jgi:hypothetical protein
VNREGLLDPSLRCGDKGVAMTRLWRLSLVEPCVGVLRAAEALGVLRAPLVSFVFGHEEHEGKHEGHEGITWVPACAGNERGCRGLRNGSPGQAR